MSLIAISGISGFGYHGVYDEERRQGQEFIVDVVMTVDTSKAELSDDVVDSVHYGEVAEKVSAIITGPAVSLIETLAARIADAVKEDSRVQKVEVTVHKPGAPISVPFVDVSVTISK